MIQPLPAWDVPQRWQLILTSQSSFIVGCLMACLPLIRVLWVGGYTALADNRDTAIYYGALQHWLSSGDLYNWTAPFSPDYGFTYPPFAAYLLLPLALFSSSSAATVFMMFLNIFAGAALIALTLYALGLKNFKTALALGLWVSPVFFIFEPYYRNFFFTQVGIILAIVVLLDVTVLKGSKYEGIATAVAASFKVIPAIFILYFIASRRWRPLLTFVATGAGIFLLTLIITPRITLEYFGEKLFETNRVGGINRSDNYSISAFVARLSGNEHSGWILVLTLLALALAVVSVMTARTELMQLQAFIGIAFLGLMVSPISWNHHWTYEVPAVIVMVYAFVTLPTQANFFLLASGFVIFTVPYTSVFNSATWSSDSVWPFEFALLGSLPVIWCFFYLGVLAWDNTRPNKTARAVLARVQQQLTNQSQRKLHPFRGNMEDK